MKVIYKYLAKENIIFRLTKLYIKSALKNCRLWVMKRTKTATPKSYSLYFLDWKV